MAEVKRYWFIDSIRGIAALSVLYLHASMAFAKSASSAERVVFDILGGILDPGKFGVVIFFMVSGFVVPFSLKGGRSDGVIRFAISRFFRLYPLYWLSAAGAVLVAVLYRVAIPTWQEVLVNLTMLQQFLGVENLIGAYWTLQIELVFYGLCAGLFFFGRLGHSRTLQLAALGSLLAALILAALRFEFHRALPVALPLALCLMFASTLWRYYVIDRSSQSATRAIVVFASFGLAMPVISLLAYSTNMGHNETWYRYTMSYGAAIVGFILLTRVWPITGAFFVWLGQISYGVYLFHPLVLSLYEQLIYNPSGGLPAHFHILAVMVVTVTLCHFLFRYVEAPAVALGHRLSKSVTARLGVRQKPVIEAIVGA